ncbi:MAG TPA: UDP-glucose/GDP-mannose dehydrogenase family protein, partial [Candidatus Dependentiae bacterium]|nr:UDP-glucose/GDP-mannose dehydrogenase family protein [Candidatus Dependentiae bacterium]
MKTRKGYKIMKYKSLAFSIIFLAISTLFGQSDKNIAVIGTGYVGLVTGAGLAEFGNYVTCADIDQNKITMLQQGDVPIYEPGLKEVVAINVKTGRLSFTTDVENAINQAEIIVIAVGTPSADDGSADLRAVYSVVESIAQNLNNHKIIVTKSTVPIGTGKQIRSLLEKKYGIKSDMFDIVSNPEFLREGTAIADFLKPDRLVIGTESDTALKIMCEVYEPLLENGTAHVLTNVVTAETIK